MKLPLVGDIHIGKPGKLIIGFLSILYILSPIDVIPDFIPIVGWLDDLVVLVIGIVPLLKDFIKK